MSGLRMRDDPPARPITVRIREACRLTGIGRSKLYMLIGEGYIETVKVGTMTLVTMRSLEAFLLGASDPDPPPYPNLHSAPEHRDQEARRPPGY